MPTVFFDRKGTPGFELIQSDDLIAVRTRSGQSIARSVGPVATPASAELDDASLVIAYPEAGVEVYRVPVGRGRRSLDDRKNALRAAPDVRFAGGVLVDSESREPVLYTENLFTKFADAADPDDCLQVFREAGLVPKQKADYATNAWFVEAPEGTGQAVFDMAIELLDRDDVEYCHPELIRPRARKDIFPQQWHLDRTTVNGVAINAHANVAAAHELTRGEGIVIAVIDDGVDIDHPEFRGPDKIVAPRDATRRTDDPRPKDTFGTGPQHGDNHGTACAGVACAGGKVGASGVAPRAKLMPIRLASGLGSQHEADAFKWAADHGADVISCSWGPPDGRWWRPDDPRHFQPFALPASTRLAIDYAVSRGRAGKGCVVLFAAGNGNESIDNDGYASYDKVIAVAACNDRGRRSVYSDFGGAVWCAFPSNDFGHVPFNHPEPLTPGIWTTDRGGFQGYNQGSSSQGDAIGDYTNSFGGTSSATPGAAGVVALVLAVNPELHWHQVKQLLAGACDRIDPANGGYNAAGRSDLYGHGRLNARTAVDLARPQPRNAVTVSRTFDAPLPDLQTVAFTLTVTEPTAVESLTATVDIQHTYIGDLRITLLPPASTGVGPIVLHDRAGGASRDLRRTFDAGTTPALAGLAGISCQGDWTLEVQDAAAADTGTLRSFGLTLAFAYSDRGVLRQSAAPKPVRKGKRKSPRKRKARKSA